MVTNAAERTPEMFIIIALWFVLYRICMELSGRQATFAKRLFRLKVIQVGGNKPTWVQVVIRNWPLIFITFWRVANQIDKLNGRAGIATLVSVYSSPLVLLGVFSFLSVAFNKQNRGWQDKMAGCMVVKHIKESHA